MFNTVSLFVLIVSVYMCAGALKDTLGLQLVGPFDLLAGAHRNTKNPQPNFHLHWRFFYDPPEFQTILKGSEDSQHHMGYYRCHSVVAFQQICGSFYLFNLIVCFYLPGTLLTRFLHLLEKMKQRRAVRSHRWVITSLLLSSEFYLSLVRRVVFCVCAHVQLAGYKRAEAETVWICF